MSSRDRASVTRPGMRLATRVASSGRGEFQNVGGRGSNLKYHFNSTLRGEKRSLLLLTLKTSTPRPTRIRINRQPIRTNRPLRLETRITRSRTVRIKNPLTIRTPIVSSLGPEQRAKIFRSQRHG